MPTLPNTKQELFCQHLSKGMTQDRAYAEAGYKPNRHNACALKTKQHISNRIAELMQRNVEKQDEIVAITAESLLAEAEAARVKAMSERGGSAAAIQAIVAKGKLAGVWVEKSETTTKTDDLNSLSDAQLAAIIKGSGQDKPSDQSKLN
jgi:Terminase small subunit